MPIAELLELPVPVGPYIDVLFKVPYGGDAIELGKTLTYVVRDTGLIVEVGVEVALEGPTAGVDDESERNVPMAEVVEIP